MVRGKGLIVCSIITDMKACCVQVTPLPVAVWREHCTEVSGGSNIKLMIRNLDAEVS